MNAMFEQGFDANDINVNIAEMLVATADDSDDLVDQAVRDVLRLLRERLNMDVIFVAEFVDGQRVFRQVNSRHPPCLLTEGQGNPLEESWCQRVADGRLPEYIPQVAALPKQGLPKIPFEIGTHLSTPIRLADGQIYGTLCCFSFGTSQTVQLRDLKNLQFTAQLLARKLQGQRHADTRDTEPAGLFH